MNKFAHGAITLWIVALLMLGLSGCSKEGPLEKAGKKVDQTVEKAGDQVEKAGDKVKEAVQDAKK